VAAHLAWSRRDLPHSHSEADPFCVVAHLQVEGGGSSSTLETHKITLPKDMWAQINASTFVVRGPNYFVDNAKVRAQGLGSERSLLLYIMFGRAKSITT
jgi:hypothetical protein